MKKVLCLVLVLVIGVVMAGCGGGEKTLDDVIADADKFLASYKSKTPYSDVTGTFLPANPDKPACYYIAFEIDGIISKDDLLTYFDIHGKLTDYMHDIENAIKADFDKFGVTLQASVIYQKKIMATYGKAREWYINT